MPPAHSPSVAAPPIGLVAAWGRLPIRVAQSLRSQGRSVVCLGVRGHADPALAEMVDRFYWVGAAQLGRCIRLFRREGVCEAALAGKFHKVEMFRPLVWLHFVPDLTFLRTFYPQVVARRGDRRDDTLLGALVGAFAAGGVRIIPPTNFAPELLVNAGQLAGPKLSRAQLEDVDFGWRMAKAMGGLDIGQSVCIKDCAVLAVEAIEGTDACIRRAGGLCRAGGFTVVKVAKPEQDMRFDVPTVGVGTLHAMAEARASVLAIEADKTILLDEQAFRDTAQRLRLSVVAMPSTKAIAAAA